jgi:hypothetical protein
MGVLGSYGPGALKYWGAILASAEQHLNIADMWGTIRDLQQQYGLERPGVTGPDVMVLRGYANRLVNGENALAAANPSDTITPGMMGIGPYTSNDLAGLAAQPTYQVRFLNQVQLPDGTVTGAWQTAVFGASDMPQTVGGLQSAIETGAAELAAQGSESSATTPKGISLGVSGVQITVV